MDREKMTTTKYATVVRRCRICNKKFKRFRYARKNGGRRNITARPSNAITCSKKCALLRQGNRYKKHD